MQVANEERGLGVGEARVRRGLAVLILEPNPNHQSRLARMFTVEGHRVVGTSTPDAALALLSQFTVDMVLVAEECDPVDVDRVVSRARKLRPDARVLMLSADAGGQRPSAGVEVVQRPARMEHVAAIA